ncbi:hypothetical protein ACNFCJ_01485 [Pseudomonas sp. NY15364]|uniref:hypothetical protein n=1 Tax=Pseudomonas sp. NY15364 TaxID=3400353 RepID=UPI003A8BA8C5
MSAVIDQDRVRKRRVRGTGIGMSRVALWLLLAFALLIIGLGVRMSLSGIASYQAEAFLENWSAAKSEPQPLAWQVAHDAAQRAIELYPVADGDRLDRLGRVYSWQYFRHPYALEEAAASRQSALEAYREAVLARPVWPYTWSRLAHAKLYQQAFDDEFAMAFEQAFQLGPWRNGVNSELATIGFAAWPQLSVQQREATLESARRAVAYGMGEAQYQLAVAQHTGRVVELCGSLTAELIEARKLTPCL